MLPDQQCGCMEAGVPRSPTEADMESVSKDRPASQCSSLLQHSTHGATACRHTSRASIALEQAGAQRCVALGVCEAARLRGGERRGRRW